MTECSHCHANIQADSQAFEYQGKSYHDECFLCAKCRTPLGFQKFIFYNDSFYCEGDYDGLFGDYCVGCGGVIDGQRIASPSGQGLLHPHCFTCDLCGKAIGSSKFFPNDHKNLFCSRECKHKAPDHHIEKPQVKPKPKPPKPKLQQATGVVIHVENEICHVCHQDCYATDKIHIMNKVWHKRCFRCTVCSVMLNPLTYKGVEGMPYCAPHYPKI